VNYYENALILSDTLPEADLRSALERIKGVVQEAGGQIVKTDEWGVRKLAYEIDRHKRGFYIFLLFKAPATAVRRLEEFYKVFDPVMKYMVIKLGPKEIKAIERAIQASAAAAASAATAAPATPPAPAAPAAPEPKAE
jgi:small subunit ribosomal protein S6